MARPFASTLLSPRDLDGRSGVCVLVFGVSGVGKTSACRAFVARHPTFLYFRASALLSEALSSTPEALRTGSAQQIVSNQAVLGQHLRMHRSAARERPVLVDVHATIDNDRLLVRVPIESVKALEPDGLILLEAPANVVNARRNSDHRLRPSRTAEEVVNEIKAEREAVIEYAAILDVPIEIAQTESTFELETAIAPLLRKIDAGRLGSR